MIKILVLINNLILISKVEELGVDIGEPDCKIIDPFIIENNNLHPWLFDYTDQKSLMISSEKILTIADPNEELLEKYEMMMKNGN